MIKRLCRKLGMPRWPFRQIDSINKTMEDLHDQLDGARTEADRARYGSTSNNNKDTRMFAEIRLLVRVRSSDLFILQLVGVAVLFVGWWRVLY